MGTELSHESAGVAVPEPHVTISSTWHQVGRCASLVAVFQEQQAGDRVGELILKEQQHQEIKINIH